MDHAHDNGIEVDLVHALSVNDDGNWRLFTAATAKQGPSQCLVAIGMATNKKRVQRSSHVAVIDEHS